VDSGGRAVKMPEIPHFLAVYGSDLDDLGQVEGPDGPNMAPLLAEMDRQLGRLVQATRDVGVYDRTAFIVTGDHGMTGWHRDLTNQTDLKGLRAGEKHDGLVVEAEEPWGFVPPAGPGGGTQGAHGSTEEMRVPLLLSGTGIRRRAAPRDARLVDVAPTICALLGVRSPADAQGRLLSESTGF
jgi:predicted AlkP superfamily pyrophosphatase or phosphodiesterase